MGKRTDRNKKKKSWWKILLLVLLLIVVGVGIYIWTVVNDVRDTVNSKMHEPVESIDRDKVKKKMNDAEPLNILLLGVDARENDTGRSDALMVLTLRPEEDSLQMISIPRDTRTLIVGRGNEDKINHAYAFGGADMAVQTVENFLDIELDYYMRINMEGLQELVDELGSITVQNEIEWSDGNYSFTKGPVEMDGQKTMAYVRMRKQDPNGDFGRTERQRKVIQGIIEKGASVGNIAKVGEVIDIMGNNMSTSLDFEDMRNLLSDYVNTRKNVTSYQVQGSGETIGGIYYYIVPEEERSKVHNMIVN
ncbi:LCP family protein [Saliterribacillus persicus]|uniref:LytR family transcriptional attenuator n=1 Tax=Saliterribacillus persicus TaxID=930114 RepID=A0A368YAD6_9BACI|nr:LCP family protein [Saliterribacillus persicus]RCW77221.1 LytR family transcriptional attenuator [Saliterribacillus persicus]